MDAIQTSWLFSIQDAIKRKTYIHQMGPTFPLSDERVGRLSLTQIIDETKKVFNGKLPKCKTLENLRKLAVKKRETALLLQTVAIVVAIIIPIFGWLLLPHLLNHYQKLEDSLLQMEVLFSGNEPLGQEITAVPPFEPIEPRPLVSPKPIERDEVADHLRKEGAKMRKEAEPLLERAARMPSKPPKFTPTTTPKRDAFELSKMDPEMDALADNLLPKMNASPMLGPLCDAPLIVQPTPIRSPDL